MNTDQQLIERLRSSMNAAVADVRPRRGLLDGISPSRMRRFRLPNSGRLAVIVATVTALVVAAVALTSLRHAPSSRPQPVAPQHARPAPNPNSLAGLRSDLAILRRPQASADELPAWGIAAEERQNCSNCLNVAKLIPRETRLVATLHVPRSAGGIGPGLEHIYLVLGTVPRAWGNGLISGWMQRGRAIEGLHLSLVGLTSKRSPTAQLQDEANYTGRPMPAQALTPRAVIITNFATVGIVPDGVTRVKWELANPGQARAVTVYPHVSGNIAIAPWTPAPRSTALIDEQWLVGATWYAADGRAIAAFTQSLAKLDKGTQKP